MSVILVLYNLEGATC